MKIYQPMLFVGLGGTGCLIGAELENRLREALCGPDGTALYPVLRGRQLLPYQLPDCLQFVYADLNEAELNRLPHTRADGALKAAYSRTSRATHGLLPRFDSYPEVARSLRTNLPDPMCGWLPPRSGEPRIAPLIREPPAADGRTGRAVRDVPQRSRRGAGPDTRGDLAHQQVRW